MDVEFKNLSVTNPGSRWNSKVPDKVILKHVSGRFRAGQLTGIMGASGAGKSSLLNAISGFRSTGVTGELLSNGCPRDNRLFRKSSCYIVQDDLLQPLLTLGELMAFAAKLKLPPAIAAKQRAAIILDILDKMGLSSNQDTFTEKLSGGQKKRLSIALELITNPPVFFLDEPTSGLDNVSARQCLDTLQSLARQNRTLVCTIHQPSAALFELLDLVYIVSQGVCIYQGGAAGLLSFLASVGLRCPLSYNPADYVIEMTDGEESHNVNVLKESICNGKVVWQETCIADVEATPSEKNTSVEPNGFSTQPTITENSLEQMMSNVEFATSRWSQFCTIFCRMMLQISRNRTSLSLQLIHHVVCSTLFGVIFYNLAQDGDKSVSMVKATFSVVLFHAYTWTLAPILTYPTEVKLLQREHFNRWYAFTPYFAALAMSTVPAKVFFSLIFLTICYYMIGLPFETLRFSMFCTIGLLVSFVSEGIGYAIGSQFNVTNGACAGPMSLLCFLGLAFYGVDFARDIPLWLLALMQTSYIRCGYVALSVVALGFRRDVLPCNNYFGYCRFADPKATIDFLDFERVPFWAEMASLAVMLVVFRAVFYVMLKMRLKKR